jgi:mRNA interferase MazF
MKSRQNEIRQGDIWLINFEPTKGDEMKKIRPAVVVNGDFATGLDLKIVVPVTSWRNDFSKIWWLFKLIPDKNNKLDAVSAVNCLQIRCVSDTRFIKRLGTVERDALEEIIAIMQNCIEITG